MIKNRAKKNKPKKVVVTLSARDYAKLSAYSRSKNTSRPLAAKRLLHAKLAETDLNATPQNIKNQLSIFDIMQIDIFNGTSKSQN